MVGNLLFLFPTDVSGSGVLGFLFVNVCVCVCVSARAIGLPFQVESR